MTEQELADGLCRELDGAPGGRPSFAPDQPAMDLAARLAAADLSGESLIKEELRARLCADRGFIARLAAALHAGPARAVLAAACLLLALLPALRRDPAVRQGPAPAPKAAAAGHGPTGQSRAAAEPGRAAGRAVALRTAGAALELFGALPMGSISGGGAGVFPIATLPARETASGFTLETEGAVFVYERRAVSPEELMELLGSSR